MMIAVFLVSWFRNGQEPWVSFLPLALPLQQQSPVLPQQAVLSLQQHLPLLPQLHSPALSHAHLLSLQQAQLASHFLLLQQQSPSLLHFPSLQQPPVAQQSLAAQHFDS